MIIKAKQTSFENKKYFLKGELNMEKSVNVGTVVGELVEVNLKVDESVVNKNNSKIKGAIVKEDFKNPSLTLLVMVTQ